MSRLAHHYYKKFISRLFQKQSFNFILSNASNESSTILHDGVFNQFSKKVFFIDAQFFAKFWYFEFNSVQSYIIDSYTINLLDAESHWSCLKT